MHVRKKILVIDKADNVGVALIALKAGEEIEYLNGSIKVINDIPSGFKVALKNIIKGDPVIKYGETIGISSQNIIYGEKVHVHNCQSQRGRGDIKEK